MKNLDKLLNESLSKLNLYVYSFDYSNEVLSIVLDSEDVIDLDKVVEATKTINTILDEKDFIKDKYMLDVSSREKGGVK